MPDYALRRTTMVDTQIRPSDVSKFPIIEAMLTIPREAFVPASRREVAYLGENIELGGGRAVLDPRTLAKLLDALDVGPSDLVLDLGCGHGYGAAVLSRLAEAVVALDEDEAMTREAQEALSGISADNVAVVTGPLREGAARHGPYDAILIEGAVGEVPQAILDQLKDGGRIAALFVQGALGEARLGWKIGGTVSWRRAFNAGAPVLPGFEARRSFAL